jgi:hypothetical protein
MTYDGVITEGQAAADLGLLQRAADDDAYFRSAWAKYRRELAASDYLAQRDAFTQGWLAAMRRVRERAGR